MKTKTNSYFKVDRVLISRKDYDMILSKDLFFVHHLFATYRRSWSLPGITFHNLNAEDFVKLYKYCTCNN